MANTTNDLANNWIYEYDKKEYVMADVWKILKPVDGKYYGDCEDFALTWAFLECGSSYRKLFWALLTHKYNIWYVRNGGGHAVLETPEGTFVDNWSKKPVTKEYMENNFGHDFIFVFPSPSVFLKLGLGFVVSKVPKGDKK